LPKKARIHAETDAFSGDGAGHFGQADFQEVGGASGRSGIARSEDAMPEFMPVRLKAKQGMIGAASPFLGIIAHGGTFGVTIDHNDDRIDIEDETVPRFGQVEEPQPQTIVQADQLEDILGRKSFEEAAQGSLIRKLSQTQQIQKGTIVLEDLGSIDPTQPHNNRKEQRQDQIAGRVATNMVGDRHILLKAPAQLEPLAEALDQPHASEVSQMAFIKGKGDFSGAARHGTKYPVRGICAQGPNQQITPENTVDFACSGPLFVHF
jgi:hypothetical protein